MKMFAGFKPNYPDYQHIIKIIQPLLNRLFSFAHLLIFTFAN